MAAPSPSPAMVCNYCACPPRVDVGCPPQSAACATACPEQSKGLPGWAIALIVIFAILGFIGLGVFMYKSGWTPGLI